MKIDNLPQELKTKSVQHFEPFGIFSKEQRLPENSPYGLLGRVWIENSDHGNIMVGLGKVELEGDPLEIKWRVNISQDHAQQLYESMNGVYKSSKEARLNNYLKTISLSEHILVDALSVTSERLVFTHDNDESLSMMSGTKLIPILAEVEDGLEENKVLTAIAIQIDIQERMKNWRHENVPMDELGILYELITDQKSVRNLRIFWRISNSELGEFVDMFEQSLRQFGVKNSTELKKLIEQRREKMQKKTVSNVWDIASKLLKSKHREKSRWMLSSSDLESMVETLISGFDSTGRIENKGVVDIVQNVARELISVETQYVQDMLEVEVRHVHEYFECLWARRVVREKMRNGALEDNIQTEVFDHAVEILANKLFIKPGFSKTKERVIYSKLWNSIISPQIDPRDTDQLLMKNQLKDYLNKHDDDNVDASVTYCKKDIAEWLVDQGLNAMDDGNVLGKELASLWEESKDEIPSITNIRNLLLEHVKLQVHSNITQQIGEMVEVSTINDDLRLLDKVVPNRLKVWREWVGFMERYLYGKTTPARLMPHIHLVVNQIDKGNLNHRLSQELPITYDVLKQLLSIENMARKDDQKTLTNNRDIMTRLLSIYRRSSLAESLDIGRTLSTKATTFLSNNLTSDQKIELVSE